MKSKDVCKRLNITPQQLKDSCWTVLNEVETPDNFTEEQVNALEAAKKQEAERASLPPGTQQEEPASGIVTADRSGIEGTQQQMIDMNGAEVLQRHLVINLANTKRDLQTFSDIQEQQLFQWEQNNYKNISETIDRATRNTHSAMSGASADMQRILNPKTGEDDKLYQEILALTDELLNS